MILLTSVFRGAGFCLCGSGGGGVGAELTVRHTGGAAIWHAVIGIAVTVELAVVTTSVSKGVGGGVTLLCLWRRSVAVSG